MVCDRSYVTRTSHCRRCMLPSHTRAHAHSGIDKVGQYHFRVTRGKTVPNDQASEFVLFRG
jgi:hypothetical protein